MSVHNDPCGRNTMEVKKDIKEYVDSRLEGAGLKKLVVSKIAEDVANVAVGKNKKIIEKYKGRIVENATDTRVIALGRPKKNEIGKCKKDNSVNNSNSVVMDQNRSMEGDTNNPFVTRRK
ncbi:MAG: hypothetical protein WC967_12075 [Balneolaceae bacterium]